MTIFQLKLGYSPVRIELCNRYDIPVKADPSDGLHAAVNARDFGTCVSCGFASDRYMELAPICEFPVAAGDYVTVCRCCWQVGNLDYAAIQRSAELVWMPELTQLEINREMPELYAKRSGAEKDLAETAKRLFDIFNERRQQASIKLGANELSHLWDLVGGEGKGIYTLLPEKLDDNFRLWPLDRIIVRVGLSEYDKYPQMADYWQSNKGIFPNDSSSIALTSQDWLERLEV